MNMNKQKALELLSELQSEIPKDQQAIIHALLYIGDELAIDNLTAE